MARSFSAIGGLGLLIVLGILGLSFYTISRVNDIEKISVAGKGGALALTVVTRSNSGEVTAKYLIKELRWVQGQAVPQKPGSGENEQAFNANGGRNNMWAYCDAGWMPIAGNCVLNQPYTVANGQPIQLQNAGATPGGYVCSWSGGKLEFNAPTDHRDDVAVLCAQVEADK
jgi:hypothetical protein